MSTPKFGGLKIQKKTPQGQSTGISSTASQEQKRSIFGYDPLEDDDDEDVDSGDVKPLEPNRRLKLPSRNKTTEYTRNRVNTDIVAQSMRNAQVAETYGAEDASIYAYDEIYDTMKAAEKSVRAELTGDGEKNRNRQSKYYDNLQESLKVRTQDRMMAKDRLNKREREEEGDEFAGTQVFESAAYKKQKAEIERMKKEEEEREEKEKKNKRRGLSTIYHKVLSQSEGAHEVQVRAAAAAAAVQAASKSAPVNAGRKEDDKKT
ncbi:coiled-coil domain-containing protein 55-domain containing protein [Lipomyces chichibuensis]|uniref:coiled-coil domain-containing protein 55-domain containing protein n=1 Tax=Lipomyces chichibuensis TaxID=1546026 RepID=UPI00334393CE